MLSRTEIIAKLGIENVNQSQQAELLQQLADSVRTRLMLKISEKLSDNDLEQLEVLIDAGKDDEVEVFIESKYDDYSAFAAKVEEDTINELENNQMALDSEMQGLELAKTPVD